MLQYNKLNKFKSKMLLFFKFKIKKELTIKLKGKGNLFLKEESKLKKLNQTFFYFFWKNPKLCLENLVLSFYFLQPYFKKLVNKVLLSNIIYKSKKSKFFYYFQVTISTSLNQLNHQALTKFLNHFSSKYFIASEALLQDLQ